MPDTNSPPKSFKVLVFAAEKLCLEMICLFLEEHQRINVVGGVQDTEELLEKTRSRLPQVALLCLSLEHFEIIKLIPDLLRASPQTKVLILSSKNDVAEFTGALELGAAGILPREQTSASLYQAIKQVCQGEIWMNQKILRRLIRNQNGHNNHLKTGESGRIDSLTKREQQIVSLIGLGLKNKEIAAQLGISEATVRHHLSSTYSKLEVDDRLQLIIYAYKNNLIKAVSRESVSSEQ